MDLTARDKPTSASKLQATTATDQAEDDDGEIQEELLLLSSEPLAKSQDQPKRNIRILPANLREHNHGFNSGQDAIIIPVAQNSFIKQCSIAESENTMISSTPELFRRSGLEDRRNAILVECGYKKYDSQIVLNDFNMCVQENTIYGLLGASGCGKTTILSCIVALRKLDSGDIYICGKPTGSSASGIPGKKVGYMPQEIALNGEFKVKEVLQYFGRIYGMTQAQIEERHNYIIKLLSLEKCKGLIRNLSDGQRRRVSLAVALLHEPDILILDEPTVGCDPLLRQSIWKFLNELVSQNRVTVIVTTHYIEETRQADRVGIMRNGRLLVEDSPSKLLLLYNASLLDDIVLKLCQKDEIGEDGLNAKENKNNNINRRSSHRMIHPKEQNILDNSNDGIIGIGIKFKSGQNKKSPSHIASKKSPKDYSFRPDDDKQIKTKISDRLRALVVKNALVLLRNLWFLIFLIFLPSTTVIVFCASVGSEPVDLRVGIINKEFTTNNNLTGICQVNGSVSCTSTDLSCLYLDSINKNQVHMVPFDTIEEAIDQVRLRNLWGYIAFEEDFSEHMFKRILLGKIKNVTIHGSQIRIKLDMSNKGVGQTLKKIFLDAFREFTTRLLEACSIDPVGRDLPITFEKPIYGEDDSSLTDFMAPGVAMGMVFFMGALTCGLTYIIEKKDGMINRTLVTGVSTIEIMISHFITQFFVVLTQIITVLLIIFLVFNVSCHGSIFLACAIILLSSISGMSLGFLAATFCNEEKNAMLLAMGTVFPSFLLAGLIWPIESAPRVIQYLSFLLPGTLIAEAFRSVLLRGYEISHHIIWYGLISGVAWTCIYWMITVFYHRFSRRRH